MLNVGLITVFFNPEASQKDKTQTHIFYDNSCYYRNKDVQVKLKISSITLNSPWSFD
ncbi:MAG: hypothetical protein ACI9S8_002939 [Chlamydiales bacterium]|jgi:hypothetical protein